MSQCNRCGDEIEFRHIDGRPTPIHLSGEWCGGFQTRKRTGTSGDFRSPEAFTDPNAACPVCGARVFFYQNALGCRVFFDDLGWPWPKHPCTDNPASQSAKISRLKSSGRSRRRASSPVNAANLYELVDVSEDDDNLRIKFRNIANRLMVRTIPFPTSELLEKGWTLKDLRSAPSFVIRSNVEKTVVEFISARRTAVGRLVVLRKTGTGARVNGRQLRCSFLPRPAKDGYSG